MDVSFALSRAVITENTSAGQFGSTKKLRSQHFSVSGRIATDDIHGTRTVLHSSFQLNRFFLNLRDSTSLQMNRSFRFFKPASTSFDLRHSILRLNRVTPILTVNPTQRRLR